MRYDIMSVCDPNSVWNHFVVVGCKDGISNTWLPECHNLNILHPEAELKTRDTSQKYLTELF